MLVIFKVFLECYTEANISGVGLHLFLHLLIKLRKAGPSWPPPLALYGGFQNFLLSATLTCLYWRAAISAAIDAVSEPNSKAKGSSVV